MIQTAISDYLCSVMRAWCSNAAAWVAPGEASHQVCDECLRSPFTATLDLGGWPHAVIHPLICGLETVVEDVRISLGEEHEEGMEHCVWTHAYFAADHDRSEHNDAAVAYVKQRALGFRDLIADVLSECVGPQVERYVSLETDRIIRSLDVSGPHQSRS